MANVLSADKKIAVIGALAEGSSIRSIERIAGVHRDTILRLGVKVGQGCTALMDTKMRNLTCKRLEMDEIWGFVGKKERNVSTAIRWRLAAYGPNPHNSQKHQQTRLSSPQISNQNPQPPKTKPLNPKK